MNLSLVGLSFLVALAPFGCSKCGAPKATPPDAGPEPLLPTERLPAPSPWTFSLPREAHEVAEPEHCKLRAPTARATIGPSARFLAEPRTLGALVVIEADGDPIELRRVAALALDPKGASHDPVWLPWLVAKDPPHFARDAAKGWLTAIDRAGKGGDSRVGLVQGERAEALGEGDAFTAADLGCEAGVCALLTTRIARVAPAGATVWLGRAGEPAASWKPIEIVPAPGSEAKPFALASIAPKVVAVLVDKQEVLFVEVGADGAPHEQERLPSPFGAMDALTLAGGKSIALTYGAAQDENGCSKDPPEGVLAVRLERHGARAIARVPAPPTTGALRRLATGAVATWLAPLGCTRPRRVVYGLVLDASGEPVGSPIPIGDASAYAIASSGDDVDVWLQKDDEVTWMRLTCTP